jgi:hypothetical protein
MTSLNPYSLLFFTILFLASPYSPSAVLPCPVLSCPTLPCISYTVCYDSMQTIDNDVDLIDRSFGFTTSVEAAQTAILSAKTEARCNMPNGIGESEFIVKTMRDEIRRHDTKSKDRGCP